MISLLDLKITCDRYADTDKNYHIKFIEFTKGAGSWEAPIGNNSDVIGMTKEQSIELTNRILATTKEYLEQEFPCYKDNFFFIRSFSNL